MELCNTVSIKCVKNTYVKLKKDGPDVLFYGIKLLDGGVPHYIRSPYVVQIDQNMVTIINGDGLEYTFSVNQTPYSKTELKAKLLECFCCAEDSGQGSSYCDALNGDLDNFPTQELLNVTDFGYFTGFVSIGGIDSYIDGIKLILDGVDLYINKDYKLTISDGYLNILTQCKLYRLNIQSSSYYEDALKHIIDPDFPIDTSSFFITTWKTDNIGSSNPSSISIPTNGTGYLYDVSWKNDGKWEKGLTGTATHDYGTPGTYTVAIRGAFPQIYFNSNADKKKILSIEQWGDIDWMSMERSFYGCENLIGNASDIPSLMHSMTMDYSFSFASIFNGNISNWDTSNITQMNFMFRNATAFNHDISSWDFSSLQPPGLDRFMDNKSPANYNSAYYDNLLIALDNSGKSGAFKLHMGSIKYTLAGSFARGNLVTKGWTIIDGGL